MKHSRTYRSMLTWMSISMLAVTMTGCNDSSERRTSTAEVKEEMRESNEEIKQETQELIRELGDYSVDQREKAIDRSNTALEKLDRRIDALERDIENDWDQMSEASREKSRTELKALREQRTKVSSWIDRMKTSTADAWEDTKEGFSNAYRSLGNAWEKTKDEFRSDK